VLKWANGLPNAKRAGVLVGLARRHMDGESALVLRERKRTITAQQLHSFDSAWILRPPARQGLDGQRIVLRPTQGDGIERAILGGKPDVWRRDSASDDDPGRSNSEAEPL
jgi:hypothetical protein